MWKEPSGRKRIPVGGGGERDELTTIHQYQLFGPFNGQISDARSFIGNLSIVRGMPNDSRHFDTDVSPVLIDQFV